jgi:hypothetical protein
MEMYFKPQSLKKFYFFEYFYILLDVVDKYAEMSKIFEEFKKLKRHYLLGESKYKKLGAENDNSERYRYTVEQILQESLAYEIIEERGRKSNVERNLELTERGRQLLEVHRQDGMQEFLRHLVRLMEMKYNAFYHLVNFCYNANQSKHGLLIFPIYSPAKLGFEKKEIVTVADLHRVIKETTKRIKKDIKEFLGRDVNLGEQEFSLVELLVKASMISSDKNDRLNPKFYNGIIKRIRDFWIYYFLKELYGYEFSLSSFEIQTYRAKQIGIVNATEFFPRFNGKIIYPTSVIVKNTNSPDFEEIVNYSNGKSLFIHNPTTDKENNMEVFVKSLTAAYFDIKKRSKSYFVNLLDVREIVCYNLKIAEFIFDTLLNDTYKLNVSGDLRIGISLESDKLPQETSAMYLKREPIVIDGKYKNIIAIDISTRRG